MFYPVQIDEFTLLSVNMMRSSILGAMNAMSLSLFENALMYWNISIVGDTVSQEILIYC